MGSIVPSDVRSRRGLAAIAVVGLVGSVLFGETAPAHAASAPPSDLSVTSPAVPLDATPGATATATLVVGNLAGAPLDVRISTERVQLLDDGKTRFIEGPDPRFAGRVATTPDLLHLSGRQERQVQVSVDIPKALRPDDYFLGCLVSPIVSSSSVRVENDIGVLVVLDVLGPRDRKLMAHYVGPPLLNFSLSSSATGLVQAKSVGSATAQFTSTVETTGWPSPRPSYGTEAPHLLPPGLTRDVPVRVSSWLGLGWYTFHVTLVYNLTDKTTDEVAVSRSVIIVNPLWLLAFPAIGLLWGIRRARRRRKARRQPLHGIRRSALPRRIENQREPAPVG
jgi:hypothetical protein